MCQSLCSNGCVDNICESDCTCSRGCYPNNWGKRCENDCTEDCLSPSVLDINMICNRKDGSCIHGCASKTLWGSQCTRDCSENCLNGTCEQISGNCTGGCTNNRVFGIACDQECAINCKNKTCRKHDGYCEEGCVLGYYGVQCDRKCNIHCRNDSCERYEGTCSSCESGWFGMECEYPCKKTCMNRECHPLTGFCVYGCISGYQGDSCDEALTVSRTDLVIAIVEGILFLMVMTAIIYLIRNSKGCKDIVNKLSRKGKRSEDCTGINRESNAYMELNRHNEADNTAMPYETLDMNTTSDTGLVLTTTAPGITTTAKK